MPRVVALYRYPVKSFTPEVCDSLTVLDDGRIVGDRLLGFRFANSSVPDDAWSKKHEFVALVNTPGIAEAAPVSKPTLYNHFKGKQELFAAVIASQC